ncbi:uncharacterized protein LOC131313970 [Rhododendron vialii]|uniref:uncharacterized protein LOC131313970 n=1 Tax=Rhododendron vialii TaxID=182163 RepID=UPI00265E1FC9|nr:uncharacterized protein LOC131313970 [Rhododendron vialii]
MTQIITAGKPVGDPLHLGFSAAYWKEGNYYRKECDGTWGMVKQLTFGRISGSIICISKAKDKRIWKFNKSGKYYVKLGNHQGIKKVALSKPSQASTSYSPPKSLWNKLWDVPTAPKICHFMWKVVKNWVASKANLFKRKCSPSPTCLLCNSEKESIEHILFHCPWTRAVWFGCGKAFWILDSPIHSADKWMEDLLCGYLAKETLPEEAAAIFQIFWAIWKARNSFVFSGKLPNPVDIIEKARMANCDYLSALFKKPVEKIPKPARDVIWSPPHPSIIKFNCDGAFNSSRSLAAFGGPMDQNQGTGPVVCSERYSNRER